MEIELRDTVVLITGGTAGIGEAVAREFAAHEATVIVNGRSEERAASITDELRSAGATASYILADITDYDEVEAMIETVLSRYGRLDVVVGSGGASAGPVPTFFQETPPSELAGFYRSMYLTRLYLAKAALDPLIEADGRIVLISSDAGRWPTPGEIGPGSASAAVMMATKVLASELAREGINVNTVSLSVTDDTPAMQWVSEESGAAAVFEKAMEKQAFSVTASDVAETVLFLGGAPGAEAITGQLVSVNGGISFPG